MQKTFGLVIGVALLLAFVGGCGKNNAKAKSKNSDGDEAKVASHVRYSIDASMERTHPEIAMFLRENLEALIDGNYTRYRRNLSSRSTPTGEKQFNRIAGIIKRLEISEITLVEIPHVPPPTYVVTINFELDETTPAARQIKRRELAILVLVEQGDRRFMIAPSRFQPDHPNNDASDDNSPADKGPDYPWDTNVDY